MTATSGTVGAVDVGGTKVAVGLVDADGRVRARRDYATAELRAAGTGPEVVLAGLAELAAGHAVEPAGLGVAATGRPVGSVLGGLEDLLPAWDGVDLAPLSRSVLGVDCAIENDADAVALAEHRLGVVAGADPLAYVTVSTGIGAGVVQGGRLVRGAGGAHPEFGHHVVDPSGPRCSCGAPCLERRASGRAIEAAWRERTGRDEDAASVVAAADAGDAVAAAILDDAVGALGIGLANLAHLVAPAAIVVGGGLSEAWHRLGPALERALDAVRLVPAPTLRRSGFGRDAGLVGAAAVQWVRA